MRLRRARRDRASASDTTSATAPSTWARSPSDAGDDPAAPAAAGQRGAADGLAHAVEQQVAGGGQVAADDHAARG